MPDSVSVAEVGTVQTTPGHAIRLFIGRFIVDFVETFAASIVGINLFIPANVEDWRKQALVLAVPAASALVSAARRAWPTIKAWLTGG